MLFRAQSLWLLLAAFFAFLSYKYPFYYGSILKNNISEPVKLVASFSFLTSLLAGLLAVGCFILIFLFRDRRLQWQFTMIALIVAIFNIIIYFSQIQKFQDGTGDLSLAALLTFSIPFFLLMAAKRIRHDARLLHNAKNLA